MRVWDMGGSSTKNLDYSKRNGDDAPNDDEQNQEVPTDPVHAPRPPAPLQPRCVSADSDITFFSLFQGMELSSMKGDLLSVDYESSEEEEMEEDEERVSVSETSKTRQEPSV